MLLFWLSGLNVGGSSLLSSLELKEVAGAGAGVNNRVGPV